MKLRGLFAQKRIIKLVGKHKKIKFNRIQIILLIDGVTTMTTRVVK